ncbi:MAG: O-antigen ligase family protein [Candidatus Marinimicrobia bacterium]|nr:O-antigen ligase family protein [Candidatus Neomarinimicrobiota bacterium]
MMAMLIVLRLGIALLLLLIPLGLKAIKWRNIDVLLLAWFTWQGMSTLIDTPWPQSGFRLEGLVLMLLFYLMTRTTLNRLTNIYTMAQIIAIMATLQSGIGALQYIKLFPWTSEYFLGFESQVTGTVGGANVLGASLAMSLPFLYLLIGKSVRIEKVWWMLSLVLIVITLILTQSRGAWVAGLVGAGIYKWSLISGYLRFLRPRKLIMSIFVLFAVGVITLFLIGIYKLNPDSANGRLFIWSITGNMIRDNLWTGVGHGNFGLYWLKYQGAYFAEATDPSLHHLAVSLKSAHSQYLHLIAETGIVGLGLFTALCLSAFASFKRQVGRLPAEQTRIFTTTSSALVTILIHALVEDVFNSLTVQLVFLILLAIVVSIPDLRAKTTAGVSVLKRKWKLVVILPLIILLGIISLRQILGELHWEQGQDSAQLGNWEQSIKHYQEAGSYLPYNLELEFYLGAAYSKTGQAEKAIKHLNRSQKGFSDKNQYIALGKAHIDNRDYNRAEAALHQVLTYYPALLVPHYWLSRIYFEQGDTGRARNELQVIIGSDNIYNSPGIEQIQKDAKRALIQLYNIDGLAKSTSRPPAYNFVRAGKARRDAEY